MNVTWRIFSDAQSESGAAEHLKKVTGRLNTGFTHSEIEPYHKGGHLIAATSSLEPSGWENTIFQVMISAQLIGRNWILTGDINEEIDLWTNESTISGVQSVNVICTKE